MTDQDPTTTPMAAPALPAAVVSGELITSLWGNSVVNSLKLVNQTRAYVRFRAQTATAVSPSVLTTLALANLTDVIDPNGMIGASAITVPAAWGGLWQVNAAFDVGSHASTSGVDLWIDGAGIRYGQTKVIPRNATQGSRGATSGLLTLTGGQGVSFMCYHGNSSAVGVYPVVTAGWVGHAP